MDSHSKNGHENLLVLLTKYDKSGKWKLVTYLNKTKLCVCVKQYNWPQSLMHTHHAPYTENKTETVKKNR